MNEGIDVVLENEELEVETAGDFLKGQDGYTPKKGIDYYTEAEKAELIETVTNSVNSNLEPKEEQRNSNENERIANENTRKEQEENRVNNEATRQENEGARHGNETERQNNESERQNNESGRIEAESLRNENFESRMAENAEVIQNIRDMTEAYNENANTKVSEFNSNVETEINNFNSNVIAKTEEYNQNAEAKILEFQQDKEALETEIATQGNLITQLQEENTTQDNLIKELQEENTLVKSQIPEGQASGENITLKDSSNMQMKLGVQGNSWQETRSGKNLFNFKDIIYESAYAPVALEGNESEFTLSISNDITYSSYDFKIWNVGIIDSDNIYVNFNSNRSGVTNNTELGIVYVSPDGGFANRKSLRSLLTPQTKYKINTSEYKGQYLFIMFRANIPNLFTSQTITNLTVSTEEMTEYEKYGAMPSSEFRSEIKNVTGSANTTVCNENLCKVSMENILINSDQYNNFNIEGDKVIINGGSLFGFKVKVKPNTLYTRQTTVSGYTSGGNIAMRIREHSKEPKLYFGDENFVRQLTEAHNKDGKYSMSFYTQSTTEWVIVALYADKPAILSDWGLYEASTTPENYIPHQSQQFTFPLSEGQRMYKDSYLADDGVHHKRGQRTMTEFDQWNVSTSKDGYKAFWIRNYDHKILDKEHDRMCSHFAYSPENFHDAPVNTVCNNTNTTIILTIFKTNIANTIEEWKEYLINQKNNGTPVILEYGLLQEIIEPYTEEQQIVYNEIKKASSYKNVTHIFSTDEISPVFEVTYKKDLETMFNNINNAMLGGN